MQYEVEISCFCGFQTARSSIEESESFLKEKPDASFQKRKQAQQIFFFRNLRAILSASRVLFQEREKKTSDIDSVDKQSPLESRFDCNRLEFFGLVRRTVCLLKTRNKRIVRDSCSIRHAKKNRPGLPTEQYDSKKSRRKPAKSNRPTCKLRTRPGLNLEHFDRAARKGLSREGCMFFQTR